LLSFPRFSLAGKTGKWPGYAGNVVMSTNRGGGNWGKLGFQRFPQAVDNWSQPLKNRGKPLWITLWKMFITYRTWNYQIIYVNRTRPIRGKKNYEIM
jgi:hypothetical protein